MLFVVSHYVLEWLVNNINEAIADKYSYCEVIKNHIFEVFFDNLRQRLYYNAKLKLWYNYKLLYN